MRMMKVGVIGLGVGEQHIIGYQSDYCEVVAFDLNLGRANSVARNYGIPNAFDDGEGDNDPQIDAVSICSYGDVLGGHCRLEKWKTCVG